MDLLLPLCCLSRIKIVQCEHIFNIEATAASLLFVSCGGIVLLWFVVCGGFVVLCYERKRFFNLDPLIGIAEHLLVYY